MLRGKSKVIKFLLLFLFGLSSFTVNKILIEQIHQHQTLRKSAQPPSEFVVTKVIDGDTIELENGDRVRYIGIDSPELYPPNESTPECFAQKAKKANEKLVLGKKVKLEKDISETDKYGRLLRYIWLENKLVNLELVRQGFAKAYTAPPDLKYQDMILTAQKYARDNQRGLWSSCPQ
jgi:micrococcal nuclease